jgi:hypothetical protein
MYWYVTHLKSAVNALMQSYHHCLSFIFEKNAGPANLTACPNGHDLQDIIFTKRASLAL